MMQEAYSRIESYQGLFNQDMDMFRGIAKRGRISEEDVIPNFGEMRRWERPNPAAAADLKAKYGLK